MVEGCFKAWVLRVHRHCDTLWKSIKLLQQKYKTFQRFERHILNDMRGTCFDRSGASETRGVWDLLGSASGHQTSSPGFEQLEASVGLCEPRHLNLKGYIGIIYGNPGIILDSNQHILSCAGIVPSARVVNIDTGFAIAGISLNQKTQMGK